MCRATTSVLVAEKHSASFRCVPTTRSLMSYHIQWNPSTPDTLKTDFPSKPDRFLSPKSRVHRHKTLIQASKVSKPMKTLHFEHSSKFSVFIGLETLLAWIKVL